MLRTLDLEGGASEAGGLVDCTVLKLVGIGHRAVGAELAEAGGGAVADEGARESTSKPFAEIGSGPDWL